MGVAFGCLRLLCKFIKLVPGMRVVSIGCGLAAIVEYLPKVQCCSAGHVRNVRKLSQYDALESNSYATQATIVMQTVRILYKYCNMECTR